MNPVIYHNNVNTPFKVTVLHSQCLCKSSEILALRATRAKVLMLKHLCQQSFNAVGDQGDAKYNTTLYCSSVESIAIYQN